jgi:hypothetical protein
MRYALESSFLVPGPELFGMFLLIVVVFVIVPLVAALRSGEWIWAIFIVLFAPLGGLLWLAWCIVARLSPSRG